MKNSRGFTLIEVMAAMTITMIIVSSVYFSFSSLMTGRSRIRNYTERQREIFFALDIIKRDLINSYLSSNSGTPEVTHQTIFEAKEDSPVTHTTFTSFNHMALGGLQKQSDQTEIEYWGDSQDGKTVLFRRESFWVNEDATKGGNVYPLLTDFDSFTLSFWNRASEEWKPEWDSTTPESGGLLPEKIRLLLTMNEEHEDKEPLIIETVITIGKRTPIRY